MLAFFRNDMGFGGNNGMTDYKDLLGWDLDQPSTRLGLYLASAVALGLGYLLCRFITISKLGRVLLALRDAESRVRFLGYSVTNAKLFVFTVSAVLAGIAGALYVPQVGIINPSEFSPGNSIEIAVWVSAGGRGTLSGAIVGAVLVNAAKTWLTGAAPETWLFVLGGLFALTTLTFPHGVIIKEIERVIRALAERGNMVILLVAQYFDFVRGLAACSFVMQCGEVVLSGSREEMDESAVRGYLTV